MMSASSGSNGSPFLFKILCVLVLTLLPVVAGGEALRSLGFVSPQLSSAALLVAMVCFLVGASAVVFTGISKNKLLIWLGGAAIILGVAALSGFFLLLQLAPMYPLETSFVAFAAFVLYLAGTRLRNQVAEVSPGRRTGPSLSGGVIFTSFKLGSVESIRGVEIIGIPDDYLRMSDEKTSLRAKCQPFHDVLRALMVAGVPLALRLETCSGKTRIYYLTWSSDPIKLDHYLQSLTDAVRVNLPLFEIRSVKRFESQLVTSHGNGTAAYLVGEPLSSEDDKQRVDPLTGVADVLQHLDNGIIQVSAVPYQVPDSKVKEAERDYQKQVEQAQKTVSMPGQALFTQGSQVSKTQVDARASRLASQTLQDLKRLSSRYLCKVGVTAVSWGQDHNQTEGNARRLMDVLVGMLAPATKERDFRIVIKKNKSELGRIARGVPSSELTVLTPEEAAVYFTLPRCDLGLRVNKRSSFSSGSALVTGTANHVDSTQVARPLTGSAVDTSPSRPVAEWICAPEGAILLGFPLTAGSEKIMERPKGIAVNRLDSHLLIIGNTRSGKTTTGISIVAQASRNQVHSVVLAGSKGYEWAVLLGVDHDARVFTPGDPDIAPVCYPPFQPPPKVKLHRWLDRLVNAFCASMPIDGVLRMHFEDVFYTMYRRCGWSIRDNKQGRRITLVDLYEAVLEVSKSLQYGEDVRNNIFGAMLARVKAMLRNPALVRMYNTTEGISVPELLSHTTVIVMDGLSETDKILLTGLLTAAISEYRMANPLPNLGNLLVIEESHYLLGRPLHTGEGEPTIQQETTASVVTMLRTAGGAGLGLVLMSQQATSLVDEATQIPVNLISHALNSSGDMKFVGEHTRCSKEQIEHIGGMKRGETIVFLESDGIPVNVQIVPLSELVTTPLPTGFWTPEQVQKTMRPVYQEHPELGASLSLPDKIVQELEGTTVSPQFPASVVQQQTNVTSSISPVQDSETDPQVDALIRKCLTSTPFAQFYYQRLQQAERGDTRPYVNLVCQFCREFCPKGVSLPLFVRRFFAISKEIFGAPQNDAMIVEIEQAIEQDTAA